MNRALADLVRHGTTGAVYTGAAQYVEPAVAGGVDRDVRSVLRLVAKPKSRRFSMKVLFRTERISAVSKDMGQGQVQGTAWFELVLHEGPPDEKTWEGGGNTVAYWRTQFARLRDPHPWTVEARMEGVAPAVIPDDVVNSLPEDARLSFLWNFVRSKALGEARSSDAGAA